MYLCPLCMKTEYASLDSLCVELTKVTIKHIRCPVCPETVLGLDKYTIHLYTHLLQKERQSKNTANETVTLNVLVKNMCKALDPRNELSAASSNHIGAKNSINLRKKAELSPGNPRICDQSRGSSTSPTTEPTSVMSQSGLGAFQKASIIPAFAQELIPSVEKLSNMVTQNFPHRTEPLVAEPKFHPSSSDDSTQRVESLKFIEADFKSRVSFTPVASSPVVLSFPTTDALTQNFITPITTSYSLQNESTYTNQGPERQPLEVKPTVFYVISDPKTTESGSPCSEPMSVENLPTGDLEPQGREVTGSPFEFEEFIKLKPNDKGKPEQKPSKCHLCNFASADTVILKMHQQLVHKQNPLSKFTKKMYCCQYCNKGFKMKGSLLVHHRVAHKHLFPDLESSLEVDGMEGRGSPEEHAVKENEHKCNICMKTFKKEQFLSQHLKTHESKQWECDVCAKSFTTKYFLKKHKRLHTGDQRYFCDLCNKAFTFQQSFRKHVLYHSDEKPYPCATCGRAFKELSTLHNHERIHTGEKPYSCETCGKSFRQRISCLVHSRIHTGAMPYECTACHKKFRYKGSEKSHKCPVSPPGQIVLCDSDKKSRSLLSSIKKKLSGTDANVESPDPQSNADSQSSSTSPQPGDPALVQSPQSQFYIVMPTSRDGTTPESGSLTRLSPPFEFRPVKQGTPQSSNGPDQQSLTVLENMTSSRPPTHDLGLQISAPDFFSDPDELFASLTFSP